MAQEPPCSRSKLTPRSGVVRPQQHRPTLKPAYRRGRQKFGGSPFADLPHRGQVGWVTMEQRARDELLRAIDRRLTNARRLRPPFSSQPWNVRRRAPPPDNIAAPTKTSATICSSRCANRIKLPDKPAVFMICPVGAVANDVGIDCGA